MSDISIFLVDDSDIDLFLHEKLIRIAGITENIACFHDPVDALDNLGHSETWPEIILLDISMPRMDGFGFLAEYINFPPEKRAKAHVFMVSSSLNDKDLINAEQNPCVKGFIKKPLNMNDLKALIAKV